MFNTLYNLFRFIRCLNKNKTIPNPKKYYHRQPLLSIFVNKNTNSKNSVYERVRNTTLCSNGPMVILLVSKFFSDLSIRNTVGVFKRVNNPCEYLMFTILTKTFYTHFIPLTGSIQPFKRVNLKNFGGP